MFSDMERLAIRLGAADPPLSPPRTPLRRLVYVLWKRRRAEALEDARLETLRQLVSTLKYGRHDATLDALLRTRAVGFDGPQIRAVVMLNGSVRLRHHILAEEKQAEG
jgi:hypothetical protein